MSPIWISNCRLLKLLFQGKFATGNATDLRNELLVERSRGHTSYLRLKERYWKIPWLCDKTISTWNMNWNLWSVYLYITVRLGIRNHAPPAFFSKTLCCISWFKVTCWEDGCFQSISCAESRHCKALKAMLIVLRWTNLDLDFLPIPLKELEKASEGKGRMYFASSSLIWNSQNVYLQYSF